MPTDARFSRVFQQAVATECYIHVHSIRNMRAPVGSTVVSYVQAVLSMTILGGNTDGLCNNMG